MNVDTSATTVAGGAPPEAVTSRPESGGLGS